MKFARVPAAVVFLALAGCSQPGVAPANASHTEPDVSGVNGCPGKDFPSFLRAFAADAKVRLQFTADTVRVTDWKDINDFNQGVSTTEVPKNEYREFTLRYSGGEFHHVASDGVIDNAPLDVNVAQERNGFVVGYAYGMSEGNSWLFEPSGNCWRLTADPEPPAE